MVNLKKKKAPPMAKECIFAALVLLMQKKEYDKISVVDISRKAGVSRMTYYRHFTSKEDVLEQYIDSVAKSIHEEIVEKNAHKDFYQYFCVLFEHLGQYGDIGVATCRAKLGEMILHYITKYMLETFPPKENDPADKRCKRFPLDGSSLFRRRQKRNPAFPVAAWHA